MKELVFSMHTVSVTMPKMSDKLIIYPVGDIHRETANCDEERWKGFLKKAKQEIKDGKHVYFIGMGDWNDFAAWSDRKKIRNASLHESTICELDAAANRHCRNMLHELEFTKGRWLGLLQGNHMWEFTFQAGLEGKTSDDFYAEELGCKNLGELGYLRVKLEFKNKPMRGGSGRACSNCMDFVIHHGKAGGKLAGTTVNQVDDMRVVFPGADAYMMGHDHRKVAVPLSSLWATTCKGGIDVKQKRQWLIRSGSFLRGYVPGEASYIVKKILRPTDLGIVKMKCAVKRYRDGGVDRTVNDIHVEY